MKKQIYFPLCLFILLIVSFSGSSQQINLAGRWRFETDPHDKGISEKWFSRILNDSVRLPGSMTTNGKGDEVTLQTPWIGQIVDSSFYKKAEYAPFRKPGNIKIPFWLQPVKYYKGAAWYQKEVTIPENWKGKSIQLFLERIHWESNLWVDNQLIGKCNSLGTPHVFDLSSFLSPGQHRITLCIDNRIKDFDPGINSHSVSDHTQSNWNGAVGSLYLEARNPVHFDGIQVYPDLSEKLAKIQVKLLNPLSNPCEATIDLVAKGIGNPAPLVRTLHLAPGSNTFTFTYPMGDHFATWSEFTPQTYQLEAKLSFKDAQIGDVAKTVFGMREFLVDGRQLKINGNPVFLRGTLECAIFPLTGYPATKLDEWLRIFKICKAYGLNHMRFHSWCPPGAAFEAADKMGFYLHVECSSWANQSTTIGDGKPFDKYLYEESQRMIETYGNHPSFCMMAYGNEPAGKNHRAFLIDFVNYWKKKDNRRIYTTAAGWPLVNESDYLSSPDPRIQGWGQELRSIINAQPPRSDYDFEDFVLKHPQPVVSHEIGQWCVYPDFKEINQYKGVLKARNFELFRTTLSDHGMLQLADSFLFASGKLQALCYKADIEAALRTKDFGGFQLLDLHDFPGQGSALVGVLSPFWTDKGYITSSQYHRFCNSTVPLARMKKLIFSNDDSFEASVEVAHYGAKPMSHATATWSVLDRGGKLIKSGQFEAREIPLGNGIPLGNVKFLLNSVTTAQQLVFTVTLGTVSNSWDFWVYPAQKPTIRGVEKIKISDRYDEESARFVEQGGTLLLSVRKGSLKPEMGGSIKVGFSSIFWNTAWTKGQGPHTLGILCNPHHPALKYFPTEYFSNYQWWDAMSHSGAIDLTTISPKMKPIVRVIDDWFTNRPLALLFEAKVGKGKVLVTGIDFFEQMDKRLEAQQLLYSLQCYMSGDSFHPTNEITPELLKGLTK